MSLEYILLIDDSDLDNIAHKRAIRKFDKNIKVREFVYAEKALEYLRGKEKSDVDLIFLDINMPRMNGFEFLSEYKLLPEEKKSIVTVMLTTSDSSLDKELAQKTGEVQEYISKPLCVDQLKDIAEKHFS